MEDNLPVPIKAPEVKPAPIVEQRKTVFDGLDPNVQAQILGIERSITEGLVDIQTSIYDIGKKLFEAKAVLPHGKYENWIRETWGNRLPLGTASQFKAVYEKFKDRPDVVKLLPLTFLQHIKQPTFPDAILQIVLDNPQAITLTDTKAFIQAHADYKEGKISLGKFEALAKKEVDLGIKLLQGESLVMHARRNRRTAKYGLTSLKKKIYEVSKHITKMRKCIAPTEGQDEDLIAEIDGCIGQLNGLKTCITEGDIPLVGVTQRTVVRRRIVEKDGVVEPEVLLNL